MSCKLKKLIMEYLKIIGIQNKEPMCIYINPRLGKIRKKLETLKIVPLAEKGKIVFYDFGIGKELKL